MFRAEEVRRLLGQPPPRGFRRAALIVRQRLLARYAAALERALGAAERRVGYRSVECPVCAWTGLRFRPYVGPGWVRHGNTCPSCGSQERHRLFWLLAQPELSGRNGRRLYLAPEASLRGSIAGAGTGAITADLTMDDVDVRCDAESLPLPDASVALVVCTDVLEHVPDDRAALAEIRRVLEPGGHTLVHVPILTSGTVEYGHAVAADNGHVRAYGPDVVERFRAAGLTVDWRLAKRLAPRHRRRFGLYDEDVLLVARRV
jgi:hypothetical protein